MANVFSRLFYGWYVVAAAFALLFFTGATQAVIGVMIKPMSAEFGWSRSATTSAIFLNMAVYAVSVIVTGRLYDRYGPKWVIAGSTLLFSLGFALMATMDSLWTFFLFYGLIAATGLGGITIPMFGSIVGKWFEARRGSVISLAFAGYCVGQFILIPIYSDLILTAGWRVACLWIAGLCGVVGLVVALGVVRGDPDRFGLRPYGSGEPQAKLSEIEPSPAARARAVRTRDLTLAEAMRTRSLWLYTIVMFVCGGGDHLVSTHLVPMVTDYGISADIAADMLAWLGLLSLAGILLAGPAVDAIGNKLPIAITFVVRVALFVMVLAVKGTVSFWIYATVFGVTLLITAVLTPTLVSALYGVTHIGFISGFITTVHMLGSGSWSYLGGVIFDKTGDYDLAFIISAGLAALAVLCTLFIREERHEPPSGTSAALVSPARPAG